MYTNTFSKRIKFDENFKNYVFLLFCIFIDQLGMLTVFQQRTGCDTFSHESLTLKYKLDNEFELVFVVFIISFFDNVCACVCVCVN